MALIVKKKDGTPRVVIDYRALNEVTVKNKYPLPLMDELFDRTQGARFFTNIDLRNGFHQIAIRAGGQREDGVPHALRHFEYTVLPMGLCNAPGTFMQLMNQTFADMLDKSVLCFLDDILIFSRTEEEHLRHLREVLTRLREQELYAKLQQVRVHAARGGLPRPPHRRRRAARVAGQDQRGAAVAAAARASPTCARSSGWPTSTAAS